MRLHHLGIGTPTNPGAVRTSTAGAVTQPRTIIRQFETDFEIR
jgi:hypothetical protein